MRHCLKKKKKTDRTGAGKSAETHGTTTIYLARNGANRKRDHL